MISQGNRPGPHSPGIESVPKIDANALPNKNDPTNVSIGSSSVVTSRPKNHKPQQARHPEQTAAVRNNGQLPSSTMTLSTQGQPSVYFTEPKAPRDRTADPQRGDSDSVPLPASIALRPQDITQNQPDDRVNAPQEPPAANVTSSDRAGEGKGIINWIKNSNWLKAAGVITAAGIAGSYLFGGGNTGTAEQVPGGKSDPATDAKLTDITASCWGVPLAAAAGLATVGGTYYVVNTPADGEKSSEKTSVFSKIGRVSKGSQPLKDNNQSVVAVVLVAIVILGALLWYVMNQSSEIKSEEELEGEDLV